MTANHTPTAIGISGPTSDRGNTTIANASALTAPPSSKPATTSDTE